MDDKESITDGRYFTRPMWGSENVKREIEIKNGYVHINGHTFTQSIFFAVNVLLGACDGR